MISVILAQTNFTLKTSLCTFWYMQTEVRVNCLKIEKKKKQLKYNLGLEIPNATVTIY